MRPKSKVLQAQDLYIQTGEQTYLVQFYNHLLALGWTIQEKEEMVTKNPEAVMDIVNGVILRLMETKQPVVRSAPSAYMKTALFYQNKAQFHESLDESEDVPVIDTETQDYEEYIRKLSVALSLSEEREVDGLVLVTLEARIDWHIIYKHLEDMSLKRDFRKRMKEVREYAENNLQSNKLLSVGDSTKQVLLGASEP